MSRRRAPKRSSRAAAKRPAAAEPVAPPQPAPPNLRQKRFLAAAVVLELAWLAFLVAMAVGTR
jgi:hypothetical protein